MKSIKKSLAVALCSILVFGAVGCSGTIERDLAVQTYAETQKEANVVNSYSTNLNNSPVEEVPEEEVNESVRILPENVPEGKEVIYKKKTASYGIEDICYWGANQNVTYAGALLKIDQSGNGLSPIIGLKRKPITLSIGLEGATGVDYQTKTVNEITQSSVGKAINDLVKGLTQEEAQLPCMLAMQLTEIKAEEELNATLGLSSNVGSFFDFSNEFDFQKDVGETHAVLTLKQIYYTVNVDYKTEDGVFSLLDDSVTLEQLKTVCPDGYSPVYVSSVSYGRIAAITLKTSDSFKSLKEKLSVGGGVGIFNAEMETKIEAIDNIENLSTNCFIYGGSVEGNQNVLTGKTIQEMLESLNQTYDPAEMVGFPISYQLSNIGDNTSAKLGFSEEYYYAELVEKDPDLQDGMTDSVSVNFDVSRAVYDNYDEYSIRGAGCIANHKYLVVDISSLDTQYIKNMGYNIEVTIEIDIKEENDGYQQIYVYNEGISAKKAERSAEYIARCEMEHVVGKKNTSYKTYVLRAVIAPEAIEEEKLWIAFDAHGEGEDTWRYRNVSVSLKATDQDTHSMFSVRK